MLSDNVKFADMINKLVILAGGRGSRFIEETLHTPKPMITIGGIPIILHIIIYYSSFGVKEFIICGGYKIENIKNFFLNLNNFVNDISINYTNSQFELQGRSSDIISFLLQMAENGLIQQFILSIQHLESGRIYLKIQAG